MTTPSSLTNSPFSNAQTLVQLEEWWDIFTSPENLYADGERSYAQAQTLLARYGREYRTRAAELTAAHPADAARMVLR